MPPSKKPPRGKSPPTTTPAPPAAEQAGAGLPRFTLATLFRLMLIASVLCAVLGGLLRSKMAWVEAESSSATFVVIALVAPLAVLVAVSVIASGSAAAWEAYRRYRRRP
ncbi:MAG: hypothetical protein KF708_05910 [Pirellulales bacterium]|nr:hypothetical protein [Pirellulales bacterium]